MVTLFLSPSCTSCRKARAWLINHEVAFDERNIITSPLTHDELMNILSHTENGTEDIISTRSKVFQKLNIDVDNLTIEELILNIQIFFVDQSLWITNICKSVLTKMRFVPFCLVTIESKNCVKRLLVLKLRVIMTKGNYSYPLDPSWSTEEITTVLHFLSQVEKAYESKVDRDQLLEAYKAFKTVVPGKAPEKQLDKAFQEASGFSIYQAVRAAKAKEKGFVTLGK